MEVLRPDYRDKSESSCPSSQLSRVGGMKKAILFAVVLFTLFGCSSTPEKTDAQKSFEETQQRIKDVQSSMTLPVVVPRVAPEGWAKKFCSLDFGYERERVHEIMGEPISSSAVTVGIHDDAVLEDNFEAGAYDFKIEYDSAGTAVFFSSLWTAPCDSFRLKP